VTAERARILAGTAVLWRGMARLATRGMARTAVGEFSPPPPYYQLEPGLAASAERSVVAYATGDFSSPWLNRTVLTAAPDGEFETLDQDCNLFGRPDRPRSFDVSGEVVAYGRCRGDGRQEAVVRDYSAPTPVETVIPGARTLGLRVAGRYVAWLDDGEGQVFVSSAISVYDRAAGSLVYRIPEAAMPGDVHDLDLQADGTVAFSYAAAGMKIAWASPAEPRAHTLPLAARESYEVRIAGDRIAFETGVQPGAGQLALADVGVTDLSGHARRLGNHGEGSLFTDDFDFDGNRVAWWTYGCTRAFVNVLDVDGPAAISPPRSGCRLRLTEPPAVTRGIARLHVDCFGFGNGICAARRVTLTVRQRDRRLVVGRGRTAARVPLTRPGRALLRKKGSLRASAVATLHDEAGRRERRTARVTLRLRPTH
jgi:hypothetical protein